MPIKINGEPIALPKHMEQQIRNTIEEERLEQELLLEVKNLAYRSPVTYVQALEAVIGSVKISWMASGRFT